MGIMVMNTIIWVVAAISAYFAVGYFRANLKVLTEKKLGKEMTLQEVVSTKKAVLLGIICFILEAGVASAGNPTTAIVLAVVLFVAVKFVTDAAPGTAKTNETIFRWLGFPLSVGIIADVVRKVTQFGFGWNWLPFLWLIAPVLYYVILAIATAAAKNSGTGEGEEKGDWRILPRVIACIAALLLIGGSVGVNVLVKGAAKTEEAQIAAEQAAVAKAEEARQTAEARTAEETEQPEAVPAEDSDGVVTLTFDAKAEAERAHAVLLSGISSASEEEQAIFKDGKAVGQLDETDKDVDVEKILEQFEMPKTEEAKKEARDGYRALLNDYDGPEAKVEIYPRWESSPVNLETMSAEDPETGNTLTYERTHSGWLHNYVKKVISWATGRVFGSKGNDEESFREIMTGEKIKNYQFFVELLELHGYEATVLGKPMYEVFPFFAEGKKIADRNQEEGIGIYGVLENVGTAEAPKYRYTEEWTDIMADYYLWLDHVSYDGTFEWYTRERGYLGPADETVREELQHDFDYSSVADNRANFTVDPLRQTNLPSEIFCLRDKQSGYRVSDFMGVNMVTSDAELYTEAAKAKKGDLDKIGDGGAVTVVDYTLPTNQQPSGSTKVTYTASTGEVKKVTPTPTPKKKTKKDPSQDPANKTPGNVANESGVNDDPGPGTYVAGLPPVSAATVAEAQGGHTSDYTQGIEEGVWTPSGETNDRTPSAGTVVNNATIVDDTGETHTGTETWTTDTDTGATVSNGDYTETTDTGETQDVHVDHAEAKTEEATNVDTSDHDKAGSESSGNTSSWDGDESF